MQSTKQILGSSKNGKYIYIYIFIGQHGTFNGADNDKPWDFVDSLVPHVGPKNCTVMSQVCPLWIDLYGTFNDLQPTANIQWPGRVISKLIPKSSCGTVGHQSQADGILSRVDPFFGALFSWHPAFGRLAGGWSGPRRSGVEKKIGCLAQ